jgi:outer membrane scaffolding protein for murein synthesis (MipA/OmpV family)
MRFMYPSMRHGPSLAAALLALVCVVCPVARADRTAEPLWELGAGLGTLAFPPWAGSRQHDVFAAPMPYIVYRGKFIQADRGGIRARLFGSQDLDVRLSMAGAPPPEDDDALREGMPGLDPVFEAGPELRWRAWQRADEHLALYLKLPLRAAVAVSGKGLESVGWFASPALNLELREWPAAGWKIGFGGGPVFGDAQYHAYYYEVAPRFASAGRPAYEADGGYGGLQWNASVSRRRGKLWMATFLRMQYLGGATFEDSPLVGTDTSLSAGIAFAWVFAQSARHAGRSTVED